MVPKIMVNSLYLYFAILGTIKLEKKSIWQNRLICKELNKTSEI